MKLLCIFFKWWYDLDDNIVEVLSPYKALARDKKGLYKISIERTINSDIIWIAHFVLIIVLGIYAYYL